MSEDASGQVRIAEVKVGYSPMVLKATLGSCLGIAFLWKEKGTYGLAHCLLPESPTPSLSIGAKFVTQAIPSLIKLMGIGKEDFAKIEVVLAGGGNMNGKVPMSKLLDIGPRNFQVAREILDKHLFKVIFEDVGGDQARQISVNCSDGTYTVNRITKM